MNKLVAYIKYAPFYLLSLLPFSAIYFIAYLCYILVFYLIGYRKKVTYQNLRNAFPTKNELEIKRIAKAFYLHFCELFIESIKVLSISKKKAIARFEFDNIEVLHQLHDENKSAILYTAHLGNWEWYAFLPLHIKQQMLSFYQQQSSSYFNGLSLIMRSRFNNICLESKTAYKQLLAINKKGNPTITFMLGDQSPMRNSSMEWTTFLNQKTAFLIGADRIAKKADLALIYPHIRKTDKGRYRVNFIMMNNRQDAAPVIEEYAQLLENNIKEQPEIWLWTHRRWKIKAIEAEA